MSKTEEAIKRLRAKDITELYGIGLSTVWRYAREGLLTPIKVTGGVTVFDVVEVEELFSVKGAANA